jgi:hypothetical protein
MIVWEPRINAGVAVHIVLLLGREPHRSSIQLPGEGVPAWPAGPRGQDPPVVATRISRRAPTAGQPSLLRSRQRARRHRPIRKSANAGYVNARPERLPLRVLLRTVPSTAGISACDSKNRGSRSDSFGAGRYDQPFCTRHYMRCPASPRPAAKINRRAPAYESARSCPALACRV